MTATLANATSTSENALAAQTELGAVFETVLAALPPDERKKVLGRIEKNAENGGEEVTPAVAASRARAHANATNFVLGMWRGLKPRDAAERVGLDLREDWGEINAALLGNPRLQLIWRASRESVGRRLQAKAAAVAEDALDGRPVDRTAARIASFVLDKTGAFGERESVGARTAPTAAPQVVINLGINDETVARYRAMFHDAARGSVIAG